MKLTIKESSVVRPAADTPKGRLWMSNLDQVIIRIHVPTVYFYKPDGSNNFFRPQLLKEALSKILVSYYPAAGKLGYDQNGRLEIVCNEEDGVLFIEAESDAVMDHLIEDFSDKSEVPLLVPQVDYSQPISSYPLVLLQVTTFKCGGVSLGVGFYHTLADGLSDFHFINSLADTARGLDPAIKPYIDRKILDARQPPTPTHHHVEFDPPPSLINPTNSIINEPHVESIFKVTVDQQNTLKAKLCGENEKPATRYSTYKILTALIWRCASKARGLSDDQATKISMSIDGRSRLSPPLPQGYFGNVILHATPMARVGDLLSEPLVDTVKRVHESVNKVDDEYLRSAIDYIEKGPDVKTHAFGCPNLNIGTWATLPIYDADFGWGRPIYMRPTSIGVEGVCMLPSPVNDRSLILITRLPLSHMKIFEKLLYEWF